MKIINVLKHLDELKQELEDLNDWQDGTVRVENQPLPFDKEALILWAKHLKEHAEHLLKVAVGLTMIKNQSIVTSSATQNAPEELHKATCVNLWTNSQQTPDSIS